jgi:hypothetical protein
MANRRVIVDLSNLSFNANGTFNFVDVPDGPSVADGLRYVLADLDAYVYSFRDLEDAQAFRDEVIELRNRNEDLARSGRHGRALYKLLRCQNLRYVAFAQRWGGQALPVDFLASFRQANAMMGIRCNPFVNDARRSFIAVHRVAAHNIETVLFRPDGQPHLSGLPFGVPPPGPGGVGAGGNGGGNDNGGGPGNAGGMAV